MSLHMPHHSHISRRTWILAGLVLLGLLCLTAALSTHLFARWSSESYAGRISAVEEQRITVEGRRGPSREVLLSEHTLIKRGGENLPQEALGVGMYVIVVGTQSSPGSMNASLIRILENSGQGPAQ